MGEDEESEAAASSRRWQETSKGSSGVRKGFWGQRLAGQESRALEAVD